MLGSRPDAVGLLIRCRCHVRLQRGLSPQVDPYGPDLGLLADYP